MKLASENEYLILELFFTNGNKISSNRIHKLAVPLYTNDCAKQSVCVYLDRLKKKGIIRRKRIDGAWHYVSISHREYIANNIDYFVNKHYRSSLEKIIADKSKVDACIKEIKDIILKYIIN